MTPERLAELEEERRFLLRSIRDIEREREVGDVDQHDFTILRDGYVARAGAVLREIENGRSALLPKRVVPLWRRLTTIGVTLAVAVGLGIFVARSSGQRLPGQTLTGGQPADEVTSKLAQASQLLVSDSAAAAELYDEVLAIEPSNPEALTYAAWLKVLGARQTDDAALLVEGIDGLRTASLVDSSYADAHCLLAVATGRILDPADAATAVSAGLACLDANPPAMFRSDIAALVAELSGYDAAQTTTPTSG